MSASNKELEGKLSAEEYFHQGELDLALAAAAEQVKQAPDDDGNRILFVELLCISGEFERADSQLNALMTLKPDLGLAVATWRQVVHAAQIRADVFALKAKPELIEEPTPSITVALDLLVALGEKDDKRVSELTEKIDSDNNSHQFSMNDQAPLILRDLDDVTANIFEVLGTNGKYFWVDLAQIVEIELLKPERILDVLWRKANIVLTNGTEGEVYIPAIYPTLDDHAAALGRKTEWQEVAGLYRGVGLRSWLLGDEELSINDHQAISLKNNAHIEDDSRNINGTANKTVQN